MEWNGHSLVGKTYEEVHDVIADSRHEPQVSKLERFASKFFLKYSIKLAMLKLQLSFRTVLFHGSIHSSSPR